jgi:hypothetical protein
MLLIVRRRTRPTHEQNGPRAEIARQFCLWLAFISSVNKCQYFDTFMHFYEVAIGIYGVIEAPEPIVRQMA